MSSMRYLWLVLLGAAVSVVIGVGAGLAGLEPDDRAARAIDVSLVVAGLLLVPASIYVPALGAMFPSYWNATPVILIEAGPVVRLLDVIAPILGFGLAAVLLPATMPLAMVMVVAVGVGVALTLTMIRYSLRLLDPLAVAMMLRDLCLGRPDPEVPFSDLVRLVHGLKDRERKDAATTAIGHMQEAIETRGIDKLGHAEAARSVLTECRTK